MILSHTIFSLRLVELAESLCFSSHSVSFPYAIEESAHAHSNVHALIDKMAMQYFIRFIQSRGGNAHERHETKTLSIEHFLATKF